MELMLGRTNRFEQLLSALLEFLFFSVKALREPLDMHEYRLVSQNCPCDLHVVAGFNFDSS